MHKPFGGGIKILINISADAKWSPVSCEDPAPPPAVPLVSLTPKGPVVGSEVTLTCNIQSMSAVNVRWERDGVRLPNETSHTLFVNITALPEGSHTYRCAGATSHPDYPVTNVSEGVIIEKPSKYKFKAKGDFGRFSH